MRTVAVHLVPTNPFGRWPKLLGEVWFRLASCLLMGRFRCSAAPISPVTVADSSLTTVNWGSCFGHSTEAVSLVTASSFLQPRLD